MEVALISHKNGKDTYKLIQNLKDKAKNVLYVAVESKSVNQEALKVENIRKDVSFAVQDPITEVEKVLGEEDELNPGDLKEQISTTAESKCL